MIVEKPIASLSVRGGVFRYTELDKLLEVETGIAANEPKQLALQMAVEKAVYSLVIEGAEIGIWQFSDKAAGEQLVQMNRAERYRGTTFPTDVRTQASPETRDPARVVATRPVARSQPAPVRQRVLEREQPNAAQPPAPPPAGSDEVIG